MMAAKLSFVVVAFCLVSSGFAAPKTIGDFVTPCSLKDPNLSDCVMMKSKEFLPKIISGVKDWGVPALDPLLKEKMELQKSEGGAVSLEVSGHDITFNGYKDIKIESVKVDPKTLHFEITMLVPNFTGSGQYKMKGQIILLPISGEGNFIFYHEKQHVKMTIDFKTVEENGKKYMKIDKLHYGILNVKNVASRFDNLFNNKKLSDNMNQILNQGQNAQAILGELKGRIERSLSGLIMEVLGPMFDHVPMNEIFSDAE